MDKQTPLSQSCDISDAKTTNNTRFGGVTLLAPGGKTIDPDAIYKLPVSKQSNPALLRLSTGVCNGKWKDDSVRLMESQPSRSLPLQVLSAMIFDLKQLLFALVLSVMCVAVLFLGFLLIGDESHNTNLIIDTGSPLGFMSMEASCVFIYRLFYFTWEFDCRLQTTGLEFSSLVSALSYLILEFGVLAAIQYFYDFSLSMGGALLALLLSMYIADFTKATFQRGFWSDILTKGFVNPLFKR